MKIKINPDKKAEEWHVGDVISDGQCSHIAMIIQNANCKDHLHIRGEHRLLNAVSYWSAGSPPHTGRTLRCKCCHYTA